jgi:hypothetical protein
VPRPRRAREKREVDITHLGKVPVARIFEGDGRASHAQRAAFYEAGLVEPVKSLIDKVARHTYKVTDEDIAVARASGLSEDQIFELVVCAVIGQPTRQYDAALAVLVEATTQPRNHR